MLGSGKVSIIVLNAYAHAKYITRLSNADDHDRLVLRVQLRTAEPAEQAKLLTVVKRTGLIQVKVNIALS